MNIFINSLEYSLPSHIVSNFDLEKIMDTNDEWIRTRTGIHERRFISEDESGIDYALDASKKALEAANIDISEISHIFVATCSAHMLMPSMACIIAGKLKANKNVFALDFNAACSGFVYGLELIKNIIKSDDKAKVLFITAEILSRKINFQDRSTAVLFGDGASAAIITGKANKNAKSKAFSIIDTACYSDGAYHNLITLGGGTSSNPQLGDAIGEEHFIQMQGREVYKLAVRSMSQSCQDILEKNNTALEDLSYVVPHQANMRIIEAVCDRLEVAEEKRFINVHKYGNTSASSIPIALVELMEEKNPKAKELILLTSFGAGLTWGSILLETL